MLHYTQSQGEACRQPGKGEYLQGPLAPWRQSCTKLINVCFFTLSLIKHQKLSETVSEDTPMREAEHMSIYTYERW